MPDNYGSASIGASTAAIANRAVTNESVASALGFGVPTLAGTGLNAANSGTGAITTAAASLDSAGLLEYNGTVAFTSATASLSGLGSEEFTGTADLTGAAASLAAEGTSMAITGTGAFTSAPASLRARGRRRLKAGHDLVDLARYNTFVEQGETILEELGQTPEPTGAVAPTLDPVPAVQPDAPADYREFLARTLDTIRVDPLSIPTLAVKGKQWAKGTAAFHTESAWLIGQGHLSFVGAAQTHSMPSHIGATGSVDNYYTIRKQDDELLAEFLLANLSGVL